MPRARLHPLIRAMETIPHRFRRAGIEMLVFRQQENLRSLKNTFVEALKKEVRPAQRARVKAHLARTLGHVIGQLHVLAQEIEAYEPMHWDQGVGRWVPLTAEILAREEEIARRQTEAWLIARRRRKAERLYAENHESIQQQAAEQGGEDSEKELEGRKKNKGESNAHRKKARRRNR